MSRDHTQLLTIAVLLVAVGIMVYGWGRDHERASDYRVGRGVPGDLDQVEALGRRIIAALDRHDETHKEAP